MSFEQIRVCAWCGERLRGRVLNLRDIGLVHPKHVSERMRIAAHAVAKIRAERLIRKDIP